MPATPSLLSPAEADARLTGPGSPFEVSRATVGVVEQRVWLHAPPTLRDLVEVARGRDGRTFLVLEDDRVGFAAFHRSVAALAGDLHNRGVRKGDRVAVAMRNLPEWAAAFYAAACLGALVVPLNAWWTGGELAYGLADSGARAVFLDGERFERLRDEPVLAGLDALYLTRPGEGGVPAGAIDMEALLGSPNDWGALPDADLPQVEIAPDDPATIFYTSGTTGRPKGAVGSHRSINTYIVSVAYTAARAALRAGRAVAVPDATAPQRTQLLAVPFFHVTGFTATLNTALHTGSKLVLMRRWHVGHAFELIQRERVNVTGGVPFIAAQIVDDPRRSSYDLSSLDTLAFGGAPSPPKLGRRIAEALPGVQVVTGWGLTETMVTCTQMAGEDYVRHPDSCGMALAVCDVEVRDDAGAVLPPGEVGELWARGPNLSLGYWRNPEATAATFVDGWCRTGDLGQVDAEGFCYIVDRKKDMLIRAGENIYCVELENVLHEHPDVTEAAVIGLAHPAMGEEPAAVVTLRPGAAADEAALRRHMAARLAAFKVPVHIVVSAEPLPRNAAGKVLKPELRPLVEATAASSAAAPVRSSAGVHLKVCALNHAMGHRR